MKALGAVFAGLAIVLAIASPAAACDLKVSHAGETPCEAGQRVVTWSFDNDWPKDATAWISVTITPAPAHPDQFPIVLKDGTKVQPDQGVVIPAASDGQDGTVTGVQHLPGGTTKVELTVETQWTDKSTRKTTDKDVTSADFSTTCGTPPADCVSADRATYEHTFDGPGGKATVKLAGNTPLCEGQSQPFTLVSYYAPKPQFATPQYKFDASTGTITPANSSVDLLVQVPKCNTQVDLIWGGADKVIPTLTANGPRYGNLKLGSPGAPGNRSKGAPGWYNGGTGTCAQPAAELKSSCNGTVMVNLSNGKAGKYDAPFVVTGSNGFTRNVAVKPGESVTVEVPAASASDIKVSMDGTRIASGSWVRPETCAPPTVLASVTCTSMTVTVNNPADSMPIVAVVKPSTGATRTLSIAPGAHADATFDAAAGFSATVTIGDLVKQVSYLKPANCGGSGGGSGSSLPVTGAKAGVAGGIAVVLLGIGGGLFWFFRRRSVRFVS